MQHEVMLKAGQLSSIAQAFQAIEGSRPVQLSFQIGKILAEAEEAHQVMLEKLKPLLDESGKLEDDNEEALEIFNEDIALDLPKITLEDLSSADLMVSDDIAMAFLMSTGILLEE